MTRPVPSPEAIAEYHNLILQLQKERDEAAERLLTAEINLRAVRKALSISPKTEN